MSEVEKIRRLLTRIEYLTPWRGYEKIAEQLFKEIPDFETACKKIIYGKEKTNKSGKNEDRNGMV